MIWIKKEQNVVSYLMVYGWGLLAIVVVATVLWRMGIFGDQPEEPMSCTTVCEAVSGEVINSVDIRNTYTINEREYCKCKSLSSVWQGTQLTNILEEHVRYYPLNTS